MHMYTNKLIAHSLTSNVPHIQLEASGLHCLDVKALQWVGNKGLGRDKFLSFPAKKKKDEEEEEEDEETVTERSFTTIRETTDRKTPPFLSNHAMKMMMVRDRKKDNESRSVCVCVCVCV